MKPLVVLNKLLNVVCHADITRVLRLNTQDFVPNATEQDVRCEILDTVAVNQLVHNSNAPIDQAFADDFRRHNFLGVAVYCADELAGLSFFAAGTVLARHNSGGKQFTGIGLKLPEGTRYQFKVSVLPQYRGRRLHTAMNAAAIKHWGTDIVHTVITTTDWNNEPFLNSARRQGFVRYGMATEFIVAGKHIYTLPAHYEPRADRLHKRDRAMSNLVRFVAES